MITPFIIEELFEIDYDNLNIYNKNNVVYIENIFKNYDKILEFSNNVYAPIWKSATPTRNFKDYYDCRIILETSDTDREGTLFRKKEDFFKKLCIRYFKVSPNIIKDNENNIIRGYCFNYYKNIKENISNKYQHYPHIDKGKINAVHYIDPISSGGTAIYEYPENYFPNEEHRNLLYDISDLKIIDIIQSKPNMCVLYDGSYLHGGYIEDHSKYTGSHNWRINYVHFLNLL